MDDVTQRALLWNCARILDSVVGGRQNTRSFDGERFFFTCPASTHDKVKHMVKAYSEAFDKKMQMAREEQEGTTEARNNSIKAEMVKCDNKWRILLLSIDVPFLIDGFTDEYYLVPGRIDNMGWWDNPSASPLWKDWQRLLDSSQKLQFVVRDALDRKMDKSNVRLNDGQVIQVEHYDKIIFAAQEPLFAFCVYIVLLQNLKDRYGGIKEAMAAIKVMSRIDDMPGIINKFQFKPGEANAYYQPSIDIVIILTSVCTRGYSLTKADRLVMVDVDPSLSKINELKCLHQGVAQTKNATFVQLISDFHNLQETMIRRREKGDLARGGVIPLRCQDGLKVVGDGSSVSTAIKIEDDD